MKDAYINALKDHVTALEIALENSRRSLAAEGRQVKKARQAVVEAEKQLNTENIGY